MIFRSLILYINNELMIILCFGIQQLITLFIEPRWKNKKKCRLLSWAECWFSHWLFFFFFLERLSGCKQNFFQIYYIHSRTIIESQKLRNFDDVQWGEDISSIFISLNRWFGTKGNLSWDVQSRRIKKDGRSAVGRRKSDRRPCFFLRQHFMQSKR